MKTIVIEHLRTKVVEPTLTKMLNGSILLSASICCLVSQDLWRTVSTRKDHVQQICGIPVCIFLLKQLLAITATAAVYFLPSI